jgi:acyl-CoA thioester hydrolase
MSISFSHPFMIDWDSLDANLHVANTRYNALATNARVAFLFKIGYVFDPSVSFGPVVLTDTISYKKELKLGDKGTVELQLLGLSTDHGRWKVRQVIYKETGGERIVSSVIDSLGGWIDLRLRKLSIPQGPFVEKFAQLARAEEFEELRPLRIG